MSPYVVERIVRPEVLASPGHVDAQHQPVHEAQAQRLNFQNSTSLYASPCPCGKEPFSNAASSRRSAVHRDRTRAINSSCTSIAAR
jgi:hypothetical protein